MLRRGATDGLFSIDGTHCTTAVSPEVLDAKLEVVSFVCQHRERGRTSSVAVVGRLNVPERYFCDVIMRRLKELGLQGTFHDGATDCVLS